MHKLFYAKLAATNIRKNARIYIPYILSCILNVAMFYIICSMATNPGLSNLVMGARATTTVLGLGCYVVAIFTVIFLLYTNNFLIKRRKKEFGLFNVLGMEKSHLSIMLLWETIYIAAISLAVGLLAGVLLDKLLFLALLRALGAGVVFGFYFSVSAVINVVILFGILFVLLFLRSVAAIHLANPIELLLGSAVGEREPKAKWALALLGLAALGAGYWISCTIANPVKAFQLFFVAVILVIVGTYLLFMAGSITLLKSLRRNKRYYYKPNHFIGVSSMMYRMKHNAVGLASICILSTMVLVMFSSTTSLFIGVNDLLDKRYPNDFATWTMSEEYRDTVRRRFQENVPIEKETSYTVIQAAGQIEGTAFTVDFEAAFELRDSTKGLVIVPLEDYNRLTGEAKTLREGEVLLSAYRGVSQLSDISLNGRAYRVAGDATVIATEEMDNYVFDSYFIVVPSFDELRALENALFGAGDISQHEGIRYYYGVDTTWSEQEQSEQSELLSEKIIGQGDVGPIRFTPRVEAAGFIREMIISFFFLGVFLSVLFVMAMILIIYYKQMSEGYEDRERFRILQQVGMSQRLVRQSIRSQVLTVFFSPLLLAVLHLGFAFPILEKLLMIFSLFNTALYIRCAILSALGFGILYTLVYALTARQYYRIVRVE
ncbi:MAG: ABC transporter permease [Ndongobacter sp.]|nr:ABC transporter permease [Ndongobacter sp.]